MSKYDLIAQATWKKTAYCPVRLSVSHRFYVRIVEKISLLSLIFCAIASALSKNPTAEPQMRSILALEQSDARDLFYRSIFKGLRSKVSVSAAAPVTPCIESLDLSRFDVESQRSGGSIFRVRLPLAQADFA